MTIDVQIKTMNIDDPALSLRDLDNARAAITAEIGSRAAAIQQQAAEAAEIFGSGGAKKRTRKPRSDKGTTRKEGGAA